MASERNRRHLFVPEPPSVEAYTPHPRAIQANKALGPASRSSHGAGLKAALKDAEDLAATRRESAGVDVPGAKPGMYLQFESVPGVPLDLGSLADVRQGIEVVAVTASDASDQSVGRVERATVFVPDGKVKHFFSRLDAYATDAPKATKGERRYEKMLDPISQLRLATLRELWTDSAESYPTAGETVWWEVWLRRVDGDELARFSAFASVKEILVSHRRLEFEDRTVVLAKATREQLSSSVDVLHDLAEVRRAKETAAAFIDSSPNDQDEWLRSLLERTTTAASGAPAVCILDTGVTHSHPLLHPSLDPNDCHTCEPAWGVHDHHGHGTEMAGLALFGELDLALKEKAPVHLRHRLESVKILPPVGANAPELYGAISAEATSRVEIEAPSRTRVYSMAVTATDERDRGQPTSWSAAIDALAAGRSFDASKQGLVYLDDGSKLTRRLFVVSAGNVPVERMQVAHLDRSDTDAVHDPAQAWNALTVGAFTEKQVSADPAWAGWRGMAPTGELSPYSTTGVPFADAWPIKPDVVFEGGNVAINASGNIDEGCPDLCLLTTHYQPIVRSFQLSSATSAATAQVARIAALISAEYPSISPEAVRALIVHSAEWTQRMQGHLAGSAGKRARARLLRRYGYGVPSIQRALRSATDALTLVAEGRIRPYFEGKMREVQYFELPWPRDLLFELGAVPVTLRVTLSYFVEPNPGRRGWRFRHRYASHGLRFEVKGPTESLGDFRKRINRQALAEEESKPTSSSASEWYLGEVARNRGSIHSDRLVGTAADIAERGVVAVYPVSGWWKDQPKRDRSEGGAPYSLIVSLETTATEVDIWTPVAQQIGVPIAIEP